MINASRLSGRYFIGRYFPLQTQVGQERAGTCLPQEFVSGVHCFLCQTNRLWMTISN